MADLNLLKMTVQTSNSPASKPARTVSTPLEWSEVAAGVRIEDFRLDNVRARLARTGDLWKPLLAAVNGYAVGGGFELVLGCDIVVAAEHARFGLPEVRRGLMADGAGIHRLMRRVPYAAAMAMVLSGQFVEAPEALRIGLINEVVPAAELRAAAERWVAHIMECAPLSLRASKEAALRGLDMPLSDAVGRVFPEAEKLYESADFIEGPLAFSQKRPPEWKGR